MARGWRRMNWRKQLTRHMLGDLVRDLGWKLGRGDRGPATATWPIPPADLESVRIGWPAEYSSPVVPRFVQFLAWSFQRKVGWELRPIPQPPFALLFEMEIEGRPYRHVVDILDTSAVDEELVESCDLYFKYQFSAAGYPWDNVVPGGYPPKARELYAYLRQLRRLRDRERYLFDVYGRFASERAREIRARAHALLSEQTAFQYEGGHAKVRYVRFLTQAARSRVCVDLPGEGAFCYRLVDNLAIGSCIVGPEPYNLLPVPLQDGVHMAFCKPDLSDLVSLCEYYVHHDEERQRLVRGSRDYFDRYLHRDQISDYYLRCCLDHHRKSSR